MSEAKIFRKKDLDLEPVNGMKTIGLVQVWSKFRSLGKLRIACFLKSKI